MAKGKLNTVELTWDLAKPVAQELALEIWDVRFEKEGSNWYLRYFIDKPGGVDINDCENFSRRIDKLLDEADPIDHSYCLEVSSPGVERDLVRDWHFQRFLGRRINIKTIRPVEGLREFSGILTAFEDGVVTWEEDGQPRQIKKEETAFIRLYDDYEDGGDRQ